MSAEIIHMSFNRDGTALSVGTRESSFHLSLDTPEHLERLEYGSGLGANVVARLGRTSLVALVYVHTPRKLRVLNMIKNEEICSHLYKDSVLAVRITRLKMIVCLEEKIYIHSSKDMKVEHVISTCSNPLGMLTLSEGVEDSLLLAYPASSIKGDVQVFDVMSCQMQQLIQAHEQPLACLNLNDDGSLVATAATDGIHIHVFKTNDGTCLYKFFRGLSAVEVFYMTFSKDDSFLAITSSNPTIHIFKLDSSSQCAHPPECLEKPQAVASTSSQGNQEACNNDYSSYYSLNSWIGWAKSAIVPMLPSQISESISGSNRAFATIRVPYKDTHSIIALTTSYTENGPEGRAVVGAFDGFVYIYRFNTDVGGECMLLKQVELSAS